jgi:hypothetical protein
MRSGSWLSGVGKQRIISGAGDQGWRGGPISGVFIGPASPTNTTTWSPPGFYGHRKASRLPS